MANERSGVPMARFLELRLPESEGPAVRKLSTSMLRLWARYCPGESQRRRDALSVAVSAVGKLGRDVAAEDLDATLGVLAALGEDRLARLRASKTDRARAAWVRETWARLRGLVPKRPMARFDAARDACPWGVESYDAGPGED